jgi:hypothetical protein
MILIPEPELSDDVFLLSHGKSGYIHKLLGSEWSVHHRPPHIHTYQLSSDIWRFNQSMPHSNSSYDFLRHFFFSPLRSRLTC